MSAVPSFTVFCDGDCGVGTPNADLGNRTAAEARREAHYHGWVTRAGGTDWCEDCQEDGTMRSALTRAALERRAGA